MAASVVEVEMNRKEKALQIEKNFNSMLAALECLLDVNSTINSLIVSGKGGVGKTYNIEQRLQKAHDAAEINFYSISGKVSTMGLYETLYKYRHSTNVLVLDDVDVFNSEANFDLLKAVLDTSSERVVSYATTNKHLRENGIPLSFKFEAKVIFITNKNLSKLSKGKSALAPHIEALLTRSIFVDLQLFTNEEVMIHIENIMTKHNMLARHGINANGSKLILDWMLKHEEKLRSPSLRMPVLISALYNKFPYDWETQCENMFLEK